MAEDIYAVKGSDLTNIANSIRAKLDTTDKFLVSDMPAAIDSIESDDAVFTVGVVHVPSRPGYITPTVTVSKRGLIEEGNHSTRQVQVDSTLIPENIKKGVDIVNVIGTYEGEDTGIVKLDSTATSTDYRLTDWYVGNTAGAGLYLIAISNANSRVNHALYIAETAAGDPVYTDNGYVLYVKYFTATNIPVRYATTPGEVDEANPVTAYAYKIG